MKAIIKMAFAVAPLLFVSCDNDVKQPAATPAGDGDDVQFTVPSALESRTMYSDDWDPETKKQDIYWGNYIAAEKDSIKIFCKNTVNNTVAVYQVEHGTNSNTAVDITKTGDKAMQWGGKEQTYNFYAFYPACQAGNNFLNGTDNTIRATVATGQSPTSYRAEIGGKNGTVTTSLQDVLNNNTQNIANQTVIYGQPDMSAAIMYAKTSTAVKDGYTLAKYGQPVPLNFNVLADVIDITLNGPVTPNNLGGNATKPEKAEFINVQTVTLEAIDPATKERVGNKIISGNFDLNMETGEISNLSGNATIQLQLSSSENGKHIYPTMYVRAATEKPVAGDIDQIRLRAFLIPGQIKNLNELQIRVMTNCGEYTQALGDDDFNTVSGKIYPVRLGYFHNRGVAFDFSKWIGQLDPNIYISELSIPGAWHAANPAYQGSVTMEDLYKAGVRAFEVHTSNGVAPKKYNDLTQDFDAATAEYYPEKLNEKIEEGKVSSTQDGNVTEGSITTGAAVYNDVDTGSGGVGYTNFTRTETITETQVMTAPFILTQIGSTTYQQKPKFSLRLFRRQNWHDPSVAEPPTSLSNAIIDLHSIMNPDGLIFLEVGCNGANGTSVNCKTVSIENLTRTKRVTLTGTRTRTQTRTRTGRRGNITGNITWNTDWTEWSEFGNWSEVTWENLPTSIDDVAWTTAPGTSEQVSYDATMSISNGEAWAIAVQSCLRNLSKSSVLYENPITRFTTIENVKGKVIVKVNTNDVDVKNEIGWENNIPALFSRWIPGDASKPETINMQWGTPIEPTPLVGGDNALRWCFSELDRVLNIQNRKDAMDAMNLEAYKNYVNGLHRTFYETSIGGYYETNSNNFAEPTVAQCLELTKELNPYALQKITSPSRNACPLGLVFMNYAIPPSGQEDTYKSADLIRAIINNNAAFLLNRDTNSSGGTTTRNDVKENTNSSFVNDNDGLSPLR